MAKMIISVRVKYNARGIIIRDPFIIDQDVLTEKFGWTESNLESFAATAATGTEEIDFSTEDLGKFRKSYDRTMPINIRPEPEIKALRDIQYTRVSYFTKIREPTEAAKKF